VNCVDWRDLTGPQEAEGSAILNVIEGWLRDAAPHDFRPHEAESTAALIPLHLDAINERLNAETGWVLALDAAGRVQPVHLLEQL
jgi:hypothetical protein